MITVIIPTANNPMDLAVLLNQLQQQIVLPHQIYLADNSADGYGIKIASRYQWSVPIYIDRKPGSIYKSWNKGIEFAKDDDVVILNDDLLIPGDLLYSFEAAFFSGHTCVCPDSPGFPPTGRVRKGYVWMRELWHPNFKSLKGDLIHSHLPLLTGWCFGLSRTLIDQVGLFDERFKVWYGDTDYSKRIEDAGASHSFMQGMFVHHYGTSSFSKIDQNVFNSTNLRDQHRYEKKHGLTHRDLGWDKYA